MEDDLITAIRAGIRQEFSDLRIKRGFTREQASDYCGISFYKIADAVRSNRLPAKRLGKDIVVLREDLDAWIETWDDA